MNVFLNQTIANNYDGYYNTPLGSKIDRIEKSVITNYLQHVADNKLLELGCGTGHWSEHLSDMGFNVTATDISEAMLAIALKKNLENVSFLNADANNLPFNNESYNTLVSITMLEFVEDVNKVLAEMYRVLKPNGLLVLGCLNINSELGKQKHKDDTFKNAKFFTKTELIELLKFFGNAQITECVYLNNNFELLDNIMEQYPVEGTFFAVKVRKTK